MAAFTKTGLNTCEIDSQYPLQTKTASCECGYYPNGPKVNNCFFNFDSINADIPAGARVLSAVLRLAQVSSAYSKAQNMRITLRSGGWSTFNWNNQPSATGAAAVNISLTGSGAGAREYDVIPLVQWIVEQGSSAHIFKLERVPNTETGSGDAKSFSTTAANHRLSVDYAAPIAGPTELSILPAVYEDQVTLSWSASAPAYNNTVTGYRVYWRQNGGAETVLKDVGSATSRTLNTGSFARGTSLTFRVVPISQYGTINPSSAWSKAATKNFKPNPPTNVGTTKTCYAPGEAIRVMLGSAGDADNNLKGFEVAKVGSDAIVGSNYSSAASHVDVSTSMGTWTPGVSYALRVRAVDALGAASDWVAVPPVMVGLPAFVCVGGAFKRAVSMQVYVPGAGFRPVKSMRIAAAQGPVDKMVF